MFPCLFITATASLLAATPRWSGADGELVQGRAIRFIPQPPADPSGPVAGPPSGGGGMPTGPSAGAASVGPTEPPAPPTPTPPSTPIRPSPRSRLRLEQP